MTEKLTKEQTEWFAERMDTAASGRVIVATYLIEKYRKITGNQTSCNQAVRSDLVNECMDAGI